MSIVENQTGAERWRSCEFAIQRTRKARPVEGENSDYSCTNKDVVKWTAKNKPSVLRKQFDPVTGNDFNVVELSHGGDIESVEVERALHESCKYCEVYRRVGE